MITLNPEQSEVVDAVHNWWRRKWHVGGYRDPRIFTLHGYAGTGKTTLTRNVAEIIGDAAIFSAFTGKATSVISRKTGHQAHTLHRLFKDFLVRDRETGEPIYINKPMADISIPAEDAILIIDEASMIGANLAKDVLSFGSRVLAIGDPGQLGPVKEPPFFNIADRFLKKIVRQAEGNPIIQASMEIRQTGKYSDRPGYIDTVPVGDVSADTAGNAGVIICHTNKRRKEVNCAVREHFGFAGALPRAGEKVMCLANSQHHEIYNGAVYTVFEDATLDQIVINGDLGVQRIKLNPYCFKNPDYKNTSEIPYIAGKTAFDFGYCLTAHKSQGSEWETVIVIDDHPKNGPEYRKWLYTGITRASKSVIVAR